MHRDSGSVILIVYVDDILITGSVTNGIEDTKRFLHSQFVTKDLGLLKYFLGIEVTSTDDGTILSQRRYVLDLLAEVGLLDCKPISTPMDPKVNLYDPNSPDYLDSRRYRTIVGKLLYLTVTRPDISFAVGRVSQFMEKPKKVHWNAVYHTGFAI